MTWRRFHFALCILMVAIALLRLVTGNLIGAIPPIALAIWFGSIAADFPLWKRIKQALSFLTR